MVKLTVTVYQIDLDAFEDFLENCSYGVMVESIEEFEHTIDYDLLVSEELVDKVKEYSC